jgi:hypothetical protein
VWGILTAMLTTNPAILKDTTLCHRFVNSRSVDELGWPPGLSTGIPLINSAVSPLVAQPHPTIGNIHVVSQGIWVGRRVYQRNAC